MFGNGYTKRLKAEAAGTGGSAVKFVKGLAKACGAPPHALPATWRMCDLLLESGRAALCTSRRAACI